MTTLALIRESLARPYRVPVAMVVLMLIVPLYIFIGEEMPSRTLHAPEIALDRALPLVPAWAIVYGVLYMFLILLPFFVIRDETQLRRTLYAYLAVWITAYVCFVVYPTVAPRPPKVAGDGFVIWGLRFLYDADPPYNCFPSLHVAHSFVSAIACWRVYRRLGIIATICAILVGLSVIFTKQHYVLDVVAGVILAAIACLIFLRRDAGVPELDRRAAPAMAALVVVIVGVMASCFWIAYIAR